MSAIVRQYQHPTEDRADHALRDFTLVPIPRGRSAASTGARPQTERPIVDSVIASARVVTRWALRDTWLVARTRSWDVLLLLSAVAVAYLLRGATRHDVLRSLRDALWFLVVLGFFLGVVFVTKAGTAVRTLRSGWKGYITGAPGGTTLHFEPVGLFPIAAARCQLLCDEGSRFEWEWRGPEASNHGLGPIGRFPATFIPASDGDGPAGEYRAEWCWKEKPSDGWIRGWRGRFQYDPVVYRTEVG